MSASEERWEHEPPDDSRPDFGFAPGPVTINVHGGQVTIVLDGRSMQLSQEQQIVQGDWNMLQQSLHQYGLTPEDIKDLKHALHTDRDQIGPATRGWLGGIAEKVADGTLTGVAVDLIVKLLHGFLG